MPSELESSITFLEETNNSSNAYFSFTVDNTGEYGVIKANKEGLRLYAAEMLKKSLLLEQREDGEPLFFGHLEWVVSDAGYDLIAGVLPQYQPRSEIIRTKKQEQAELQEEIPATGKKEKPAGKGCFLSLLLLIIASLILFIAVKAFANLHA